MKRLSVEVRPRLTGRTLAPIQGRVLRGRVVEQEEPVNITVA
jgi:hypothetical protein